MRRIAKYAPILAIFSAVTALAGPDTTPVTTTPTSDASATTAPKPVPMMSPAEMNVKASAIQAQLAEDSQQVLNFKSIANKKKDIIKLNCVNDRIVQINAQRNIADDTFGQLQAAIGKNSDDRQTLFDQLRGIGENVKGLREQASGCIGDQDLVKQESGVEVEHPEIIDDPTDSTPFQPEVEAPGYASAFH